MAFKTASRAMRNRPSSANSMMLPRRSASKPRTALTPPLPIFETHAQPRRPTAARASLAAPAGSRSTLRMWMLPSRVGPSRATSRVRRIERELGQKPFSRGIPTRDLFELDQIGAPRDGVLVEAFEMRLVPQTGTHEFSRPAAPSRTQAGDGLDKRPPVVAGAGRRRDIEEGSDRISRPDHVVEYFPR